MDYSRVGRGARLRRVIVDRHNLIEAQERIGYDEEADRQRFTLSPGGVTVIPGGRASYFARGSRGTSLGGYSE